MLAVIICSKDPVLIDLRNALQTQNSCSDNGLGTLYCEYIKEQLLCAIIKRIMDRPTQCTKNTEPM